MGNDLRFGGTLEITHTKDTTINIKRLKGILQTINEFYPELQIEQPEIESVWYGFRPCTPSGLPLISRARNMKNLTIAAGHAMMGLSLAPATGKLVEELINGKKCSIDMGMFQ
jgi:D-amino-acid dehydrogenase